MLTSEMYKQALLSVQERRSDYELKIGRLYADIGFWSGEIAITYVAEEEIKERLAKALESENGGTQ